jgi:hypothetical protein
MRTNHSRVNTTNGDIQERQFKRNFGMGNIQGYMSNPTKPIVDRSVESFKRTRQRNAQEHRSPNHQLVQREKLFT